MNECASRRRCPIGEGTVLKSPRLNSPRTRRARTGPARRDLTDRGESPLHASQQCIPALSVGLRIKTDCLVFSASRADVRAWPPHARAVNPSQRAVFFAVS